MFTRTTIFIGLLLLALVASQRNQNRGGGERSAEECDGTGQGYRGLKITRSVTDGTDTVVYTFRAFPVPRIRIRYFEGTVDDEDVEKNNLDEKLEIVASVPGYFFFANTDDDPAFTQGTDNVTRIVSLRKANGNEWESPVLNTTAVGEFTVRKFTICRKIADFCLVAYISDGDVTFEGYQLTGDVAKINLEFVPSAIGSLTASDRLGIVVKVHYKSDATVEDNADENEDTVTAGGTPTTNDLLVGYSADDVAAFFNWEREVIVVNEVTSAETEVTLLTTEISNLNVIDRRRESDDTSGPGDDGDNDSGYDDNEEDDAVKNRLEGMKTYVFVVDGSLVDVSKVIWDPESGVGAVSSGAGAISLKFVQAMLIVAAVLALLL